MLIRLLGLSLSTALLIVSPAVAADENLFTEHYMSVFGGVVVTPDIVQAYAHPATPVNNGNTIHKLNAGGVLGLAVGTNIYDGVRAEVDLSHSHSDINGHRYDNPIFTTQSGPAAGHVSSTSLFANIWYDFDEIGVMTPYVGGGLGASFVQAESMLLPGSKREVYGSDWAFAYQIGVGSVVKLNDWVDLDIGYRFKSTIDVNLSTDFAATQVNSPFDVNSHVVQVGLRVHLSSD